MISKSDKISERERLLKLIDGVPVTLPVKASRNYLKEFFLHTKDLVASARTKFLHDISRNLRKGKEFVVDIRRGKISLASVKISFINKILRILVFILFLYIVVDLLRGTQIKKGDFVLSFPSKQETALSKPIIKLESTEYYLDQIHGKDIFNPYRIEAKGGGEGSLPIADGLKFVGVDWGNPPTAMIEDVRNTKTHFIKKGDSIREMKVVDVLRDRVILGFKDQLFELK